MNAIRTWGRVSTFFKASCLQRELWGQRSESDLLLLSSGVPSFEAMGGIENFLELPFVLLIVLHMVPSLVVLLKLNRKIPNHCRFAFFMVHGARPFALIYSIHVSSERHLRKMFFFLFLSLTAFLQLTFQNGTCGLLELKVAFGLLVFIASKIIWVMKAVFWLRSFDVSSLRRFFVYSFSPGLSSMALPYMIGNQSWLSSFQMKSRMTADVAVLTPFILLIIRTAGASSQQFSSVLTRVETLTIQCWGFGLAFLDMKSLTSTSPKH